MNRVRLASISICLLILACSVILLIFRQIEIAQRNNRIAQLETDAKQHLDTIAPYPNETVLGEQSGGYFIDGGIYKGRGCEFGRIRRYFQLSDADEWENVLNHYHTLVQKQGWYTPFTISEEVANLPNQELDNVILLFTYERHSSFGIGKIKTYADFEQPFYMQGSIDFSELDVDRQFIYRISITKYNMDATNCSEAFPHIRP